MYSTSCPMLLHVDYLKGSDTNPGDLARPLATIQAAVNKVPKRILHPVVIRVASGNYDGAIAEGFIFDNAGSPDGAYLAITGTLIEANIAAGMTSGIATDGTSGTQYTTDWGTLEVAGAGWTLSDLRGKLVEIVDKAGNSQIKAVSDNTGDTITIAGDWIAPIKGDQFTILEWGTYINTSLALPPNYIDMAAPNRVGFILGCGSTEFIRPSIFMEQIAFTNPGLVNVLNSSSAGLTIRRCRFSGASRCIQSQSQAVININDCIGENNPRGIFFTHFGRRSGFSSIGGNVVDSGGQALYINQASFTSHMNSFRGQTRTVDSFSVQTSYMYGDILEGTGTGIAISSSSSEPWNITIVDCKLSKFEVVILADNPYAIVRLSKQVEGDNNHVAINVSKGGTIVVSPETTLTGNSELIVDGVLHTLADLRNAIPRVLHDGNYLTRVYES